MLWNLTEGPPRRWSSKTARPPRWKSWLLGVGRCGWFGIRHTTATWEQRNEPDPTGARSGFAGPGRTASVAADRQLPLSSAEPCPRSVARPSVSLDDRRLPRLTGLLADPELFLAGSIHRAGDSGPDSGDLQGPVDSGQPGHLLPHGDHGSRRHGDHRRPGLPFGLLHGALCFDAPEDRALPGCAPASVVFVPGPRVRLAADPGQRGNPELVHPAARPDAGPRPPSTRAGHRGSVPIGVVSGDVHCLRLRLVALHDSAGTGGSREGATLAAGGLGRPWGTARADSAACHAPPGIPGGHRRVDLHLLPHPWRFRRSLLAWQLELLHRPGRPFPDGNCLQHSSGGGVYRRPNGDHGLLPCWGEDAGGIRCALRRKNPAAAPRSVSD